MMLLDRVFEPLSLSVRLWQRSRKKSFKFRGSEVMLLRYPKSGVTWLRVMISHVYQSRLKMESSEIVGSRKFHEMAPDAPRIFIGEHIVDPKLTSEMMAAIGVKKTILLVRDPRDVAVSMYFHLAKRSTPLERAVYSVPKEFEDNGMFSFMMNPVYGMPNIIRFMNTWWPQVTRAEKSLTIRYVDMRADPATVLGRTMAFLGANASDREIAESVAFATLESMKERERDGFFRSQVLRPGDKYDEDSYKVRKGEVGGFVQHFRDQQVAELNALLHATLDEGIGYH
jgi:hypothetical protein